MKIPNKVLMPLLAGGTGAGFCLGMLLIFAIGLALNLAVALLLGLVAHLLLPQYPYLTEVAVIYAAAIVLSVLAGRGAK